MFTRMTTSMRMPMHTRHARHRAWRTSARASAALPVPQRVRADNVARRLPADRPHAESRVPTAGPVDQIHFHEVGTLDALADITAVCLLVSSGSRRSRSSVSPVHVGSGHVRCAHGILPVPAPGNGAFC